MKSEIDIKDDIYRHLHCCSLTTSVSGQLSKRGVRPTASDKEDIIISVLSSDTSDEIQTAIVVVNVYVPDQRLPTGEAEEHSARLRELCRLGVEVLNRGYGEGCEPHGLFGQCPNCPPRLVGPVNGKEEHCISHRLLYRAINERETASTQKHCRH